MFMHEEAEVGVQQKALPEGDREDGEEWAQLGFKQRENQSE